MLEPPAGHADGNDHSELVRRHGADAVAFQALHHDVRWWRDDCGDAIPYVDSRRTWIAIGTPLAPPIRRALAASRFAATARGHGRRVAFFGVEGLQPFASWRRLLLGHQSELWASRWPATLATSGTLREQIRRARAKGVRVRLVAAAELRASRTLRAAVVALRNEWLDRRALAPMGFLVQAEPLYAMDEHLYLIAERDGTLVEFLSAVPIDSRDGWLIEDVFRARNAPNGTTELVIDRLMAELIGRGHWATTGLTPLAGGVPRLLQAAGAVMTPLYDFAGLHRFRRRLRPTRWAPVWLVWDRGPAWPIFLDVLRAFAGGRLVGFAARSIVGRPEGLPWLVALPLVPWTVVLALSALAHDATRLGFSTSALWGWAGFDAALAWMLLRAARRPRAASLAALTLLALADAALSVHHLWRFGLGHSATAGLLRLAATGGPVAGTAALAWATALAASRRARHA